MGSTEQSIKEAVLSAALANVALLKAAPSLGCLKTYIKVFSDLCSIYSLHVPDLARILQYSSTDSLSFPIGSSVTDHVQKVAQVQNFYDHNVENLEIKKEPDDPEYDTINGEQDNSNNSIPEEPLCNAVNVKQDIANNRIPEEPLCNAVNIKQDITTNKIPEEPLCNAVNVKQDIANKRIPEEPLCNAVNVKKDITTNRIPEEPLCNAVNVKQDIITNKIPEEPLCNAVNVKQDIATNKIPEEPLCNAVNVKQDIANNRISEEPWCDIVKAKQENSNNNALYNVCIYDTRPTIEDNSLEMHVKNESKKLEMPIDIELEIPLKRKNKSKRTRTECSNEGTSLKKYKENENIQFETSFDCALWKTKRSHTESKIQSSTMKKPVKKENSQLETPFDRALGKNERYHTESSIHGIALKKYVENKSTLLETPFDCTLWKRDEPSKGKDISDISFLDQTGTTIQETSQMMSVPNEDHPKIHPLDEDISPDDTPSVDSDPYSTMLRNISKSLTESNSSLSKSNSSMLSQYCVYSILHKNGKQKYASSLGMAKQIMTKHGMLLKFSNDDETEFKSCLIYVRTTVLGPHRDSVLGIWSKDENRAFKIPFENIVEISKWNLPIIRSDIIYNNIVKVCYKSTKTRRIECLHLCICKTRGYIGKIIKWLNTFLG